MLRVKIVTPFGPVAEEDTDMVTAPGDLGELGILTGHIPLITGLMIGELSIRSGQNSRYFAVSEGYMEVFHDRVSVITKTCEESQNIDVEWAKQDLEEALEDLKHVGENQKELHRLERRVRKAELRIRVAARSSNAA